MAESSVYYTRQHGWDTTSTDYHIHVATMERMTTMPSDVPRYPNVHRVFNNRVILEKEEEAEVIQHERTQKKKQQQNPPKAVKKVHMIEKREMIPQVIVEEESIDSETDGFLRQKHKGFELCKWKSFKVH